MKKVELHGTADKPRLKWTCPLCHKRNDTYLQPPLRPTQILCCKFCKHSCRIEMKFELRKDGATGTTSAESTGSVASTRESPQARPILGRLSSVEKVGRAPNDGESD